MNSTITVDSRKVAGRSTNALRGAGQVPGVVYGFEIKPTNITLNRNEVERLYAQAGESTVIELILDKKSHSVLIQDIQRDPLTDFIIHIDFRQIDMSRKVETTIPITIVGESVAVKELGGILVQSLGEVEVEALPNALVRELTVNAEVLATFDDIIRVSDIVVPEGMEILTAPERTVAVVQPPRSEAELEALDAAVEVDVSKVEIESEKKEEAEEGEAAQPAEEKAQ